MHLSKTHSKFDFSILFPKAIKNRGIGRPLRKLEIHLIDWGQMNTYSFVFWKAFVLNSSFGCILQNYIYLYKCMWGESPVAQRLKRLPAMREMRVRSLSWEDPLEKEMATHSSILAWRIPWREEPSRLQSTGSQRVRHDWATSLSLSLSNVCGRYNQT